MPEKQGKCFYFNKTVVMMRTEKALDLQMKFWNKAFTKVNIRLASFYIKVFIIYEAWLLSLFT